MSHSTLKRLLLIVAIALAVTPAAKADLVFLPNGNVLEGMVLSAPQANELTMLLINGGRVSLPMAEVSRVEIEPPAMYYMRQSDWRMQRGEERASEEAARQALAIDPAFAPARERVQEIQDTRKRQSVQRLVDQAEALMARKQFRDAISRYEEGLRLNPSEEVVFDLNYRLAVAYSRLAFSFYDHAYNEGARMELQRAMEINPNCAEIYYVMGTIYKDEGDINEAQRNYEQALNLDPTHVPSRSELMLLSNERSRLTTEI